MRAHLLAGTFGLALLLALAACAGATDAGQGTEAAATDPTQPVPGADDGGANASAAQDAARSNDPTPPAPPDCSLAALPVAADVTPQFVILGPGQAPPAMTGGALGGSYVVHAAKVLLPSAGAGIVNTAESKGRVSAWAVFAGSRYRLYLSADFTIATSFGTQAQGASTESQGGFTVSGAALTLDHACDTAPANEADYSYSDLGGGHATLLIRTPTPYGDTYMQLDAVAN
jgi:hypothetical protein